MWCTALGQGRQYRIMSLNLNDGGVGQTASFSFKQD
jgi:hypothetical protein